MTDAQRQEHPAGRPPFRRGAAFLAGVLLWLATVLVFAPLREAAFLQYDDDSNVTANLFVRSGFTWPGIRWAATTPWGTTNPGKWTPLVWLSHMLDCQLFGLDAGAHHLSNVLLHAANSVLLLYTLLRLTTALGPSAFVAALFAVHPLHVEPVAWVSGRTHLLSTFFWLATILAYVRYTERPSRGRYLITGAGLILSLMSKGMMLTLPITLLLLDYWPLRRWPAARTGDHPRLAGWPLVQEKIPLLLIAGAGFVVELLAQRFVGALQSAEQAPVPLRIANAVVSYASYIWKTVWPTGLAIPYPWHPAGPPAWQIAGAALALIGLSGGVIVWGRSRRYLVTGWLWYLVTLLPVIGFVSVGHQAMADRYTYVPLIGLFLAIAWGAAEAGRTYALPRPVLAVAAGGAIIFLISLTRTQIGYWHDGSTLFRHTLAVTQDNPFGELSLGVALAAAGEREEARAHLAAAVRIDPSNPVAHTALGSALLDENQAAAAEEHFRTAVRLRPTYVPARMRLGALRLRQGDAAEAQEQFRAAVEAQPQNVQAHAGLAQALEREGRLNEARVEYDWIARHYREMLRLNPDDASLVNALGAALKATGQRADACGHFAAALRLNPSDPDARYNAGLCLAEDGDIAGAEAYFRDVLRLSPNHPQALAALAALGRRATNGH